VLVLLGIPGGLLLPKRTWNPGRCHHSRFYEYTPFCNGPVDVNCSPIVTPPSSRFCPWSTLRPPHYAVRGSGEPILSMFLPNRIAGFPRTCKWASLAALIRLGAEPCRRHILRTFACGWSHASKAGLRDVRQPSSSTSAQVRQSNG